ncbi:beta-lactamase superfamily II metal-dependent hydrolase [Catenulispora sp. GP43]|uniref:ComEC/Rec2 family competence protein n=1 Tax=Catenulispora sp. GP43 TaxID=3156263 RepID=UPI003518F0F4
MNEQGPWISPGPEPDPGRGDGLDSGGLGPGSRGGDGFRGDPNRSVGRRAVAAALLFLLLISIAAALLFIRSQTVAWPPPDWIFAACDVGQGDALALAVGPAEAVVVDTGPDPAKADRCLTLLGVRKVPLLVLTHFHADHIDGVPGVLKGRAVAEIETTNDRDPPKGASEVAAWASSARVPTSVAAAGEHRRFGPVSWDVLWPDPNESPPTPPEPVHKSRRRGRHQARASPRGGGEEGSGPNNSSVVLQVTVATRDGAVRLLLTGDIEPPSQAAILAAHPDLAADVLKVPHHGSAHQDPDLFAAVHPRVAVISVGKGNTYGHPAPRTIALASGAGARVFRTDDDGQVVVFGTAARLRVATRH